jgi:hypothetical protein
MRTSSSEQAFNVQHYLSYWRAFPTRTNFLRVLGAAEGYDPLAGVDGRTARLAALHQLLDERRCVYAVGRVSGGRGDRRCLQRYTRTRTGEIKLQTFRQGSDSWTKPHHAHHLYTNA